MATIFANRPKTHALDAAICGNATPQTPYSTKAIVSVQQSVVADQFFYSFLRLRNRGMRRIV